MLIIGSKNGQLGNRLKIYAVFIAYALEHNITIINPSFHDYADLFETTSKDSLCCFPPKNKLYLIDKIQIAFHYFVNVTGRIKINLKNIQTIQIAWGEYFFLDSPEYLNLVKKRNLLIFQGFLLGGRFIDEANFVKHADNIRAYFTPLKQHQQNISALINKTRETCDIVIGVHIRHGDYKEYEGGRYFYSIDKYVEIMEKVESLLANKKVVFLLCSNAKHDESKFSKLSYVFGNNHIIEDMYSLAQCDYIIGPPSSYSTWASFYGNVPLYKIVHPDATITLESFRVHQIPLVWN